MCVYVPHITHVCKLYIGVECSNKTQHFSQIREYTLTVPLVSWIDRCVDIRRMMEIMKMRSSYLDIRLINYYLINLIFLHAAAAHCYYDLLAIETL